MLKTWRVEIVETVRRSAWVEIEAETGAEAIAAVRAGDLGSGLERDPDPYRDDSTLEPVAALEIDPETGEALE